MYRFKLKQGLHREGKITYRGPAKLSSPHRLDKMYANKFELLGKNETEDLGGVAKAIEDVIVEDVVETTTETTPQESELVRKYDRSARKHSVYSVDADGTETFIAGGFSKAEAEEYIEENE